MPFAPAAYRDQIAAEDAARRASHEAEASRQARSGFGCDLGPYVGRTPAEIAAEAQRRFDLRRAPEAVLKRAVIALAEGGSYEAVMILSALDRGDANSADRARALLNSNQAKAA